MPTRSRPWPAVAAFIIAFAGALLVGLLQGFRPFYADAAGYWTLASSFTQAGHFSLLNYESELRGYVLPLVIYLLKLLATTSYSSQSTVATVFNALLFALIGAVLAPRLAEVTWPEQHWGAPRRVALTTVLLVFWSGDLNYPLTDFPGLAMVLLALVAIARADRPGWMLLAGIAGGAAVNLRPAYLPLALMLLVVLVLNWSEQPGAAHTSTTRRALCAGLLVLGFVAVSLPQGLSTHRHYGTWSFIPGSSTSLTEEVLTKGMYAQRWDSYEQPPVIPNAIEYPDVSGRRLLTQQPGDAVKSTGQYLDLLVSHPTIIVPMLVRHVVNGLDARYSTIYVEHFDSGGHIWLRVSGFLLVFLALVRLLWPEARRGLGQTRWRYPLALSICCVTVLPSAIETRYILPIYLLSYIVALAPGWPNPIGAPEAGWARWRTTAALTVAGLVFAAFVWHVVSGVTGHPVHPV
jgi:hypothetical protein